MERRATRGWRRKEKRGTERGYARTGSSGEELRAVSHLTYNKPLSLP
jgi:hypothetical protein